MTKKSVLTFFTLLCCLFFSDLKSQEQNTATLPLATVLNNLEAIFNVSFSYADHIVAPTYIKDISEGSTLTQALEYIENNTDLTFDFLNERFIVITENIINEVQELDQIYISNLLTTGISKSRSGITRIIPEQFGILPGIIEPDVLQAVQALPGIFSTEETVSDVNIRGGTNDQNLILWDGIKMYQSGHFFGLISAFNPYLTKRVEVIKNGTSARYGDGVSGTINIELDDKVATDYEGSVSANLLHLKGFATLPVSKKLTLSLSARRSNTDFIQSPTYTSYTDRIFQDTDLSINSDKESQVSDLNFYFYDVSTNLIYDISKKDKLKLSATTIYNKLGYDETIRALEINERSGINQSNNGARLVYTRNWNKKHTTDVELYLSNYNLNARNFNLENGQQLDQENEVLDVGLKLQSSNKLTDTFIWNNGYQFTEVGARNLAQTNRPIFFSNERDVIRTHSLYSELSYLSPSKGTQFITGVRGNYLDTFNTLIIEPRVRFSQRFLSFLKISALGEFKSQSIFQIIDQPNDFLGLQRSRWIAANDDSFPILKSKQASVSLDYTKSKWLLSVEGYIKKVDGISSRSQGFQNQFQFTNAVGSYDVMGIDFLVNKQFQKFGTWLSYSFSKNNFDFESLNNGRRFPNNTDIRHSLTYGSTYTINDFKFSLGFNWRTGTPLTSPREENPIVNGQIIYDLPNSSVSDSFLRFDVSAIYKFELFSKNVQVGASIWNLLDNNNILNTYYLINSNDEIQKITVKSLGITPNFSLQYSF
ncbi:TonB-dependent receptor plug domain-containing protein [uncultured Dokdonia sp.]|uniref:TonB-dependent receptor plug domain-containing protein n=1 Tax=uncultured Dokdonia sp. TaxID=575653 RepID=UPI0026167D3C|nr:TonB-dependent receptor plug domain-containing protein [uncultured Dokdonia sp.]